MREAKQVEEDEKKQAEGEDGLVVCI